MENWVYQKECLDLFAQHIETGQNIDDQMIEKIKRSMTFMEAMATLRQLSFAFLDLAWHEGNPSLIADVKSLEDQVLSQTDLFESLPEASVSCSFFSYFSRWLLGRVLQL